MEIKQKRFQELMAKKKQALAAKQNKLKKAFQGLAEAADICEEGASDHQSGTRSQELLHQDSIHSNAGKHLFEKDNKHQASTRMVSQRGSPFEIAPGIKMNQSVQAEQN